MKDSLQPGITHELKYRVPVHKTVPALLPESPINFIEIIPISFCPYVCGTCIIFRYAVCFFD